MSATAGGVAVVPCSGIGKPYGSVSREAAYILVDELRPGKARLVALSKLVLGAADAVEAVARQPAITLDGCKLACATKMVTECGGRVACASAVLDVYRRHRQLKPQGISQLNDGGMRLARAMAEELALEIDALTGGRHA